MRLWPERFPRVWPPDWYDGLKRPRRRGALAVLDHDSVQLVLPKGFLLQWHEAELTPLGDGAWVSGGLSQLRRQLLVGSPEERREAAQALLSVGAEAWAATTELLRALCEDELPAVRWRAAEVLRRVSLPTEALAPLIKVLRSDPCRSVRWRVAEALGARSLPERSRAIALLEASGDSDHWVRWHANRVLGETVDPQLLKSLLLWYAAKSTDDQIRAYALREISKRERLDRNELHALAQGMSDPSPDVRKGVAEVVARNAPVDADIELLVSLEFSLRDARPDVREAAVRAMGAIARTNSSARVNLEASLGDPDPAVRATAHREFSLSTGSLREKTRWLRVGVSDPAPSVRLEAALALSRFDGVDASVVSSLTSTLWQERPPLEAWRALVAVSARDAPRVKAAVSAVPSVTLAYLVTEDVAAGILPTVGLRLWHDKARVRFPNKEGGDMLSPGLGYPWVNAGVHRSWESHDALLRRRLKRIVKQVCVAVQRFEHAHLVAAVEFARVLPSGFHGQPAPVRIEGRPVGPIIEGGNVSELSNVEGSPATSLVDARVDFLFATDLRFCQYASFGATCARERGRSLTSLEKAGARAWTELVARICQVLVDAGMRQFVEDEWFTVEGWESSRYGQRYERPYEEIGEGLTQVLRVFRSRGGSRLRRTVLEVARQFEDEVESTLWADRIRAYPREIVGLLSSGAAGDRAAWYASGQTSQKRCSARSVS